MITGVQVRNRIRKATLLEAASFIGEQVGDVLTLLDISIRLHGYLMADFTGYIDSTGIEQVGSELGLRIRKVTIGDSSSTNQDLDSRTAGVDESRIGAAKRQKVEGARRITLVVCGVYRNSSLIAAVSDISGHYERGTE